MSALENARAALSEFEASHLELRTLMEEVLAAALEELIAEHEVRTTILALYLRGGGRDV